MAYNQQQHLRDNIAAIRLAPGFRNGITPQPEENAALANYAGFGGLKAVLFPAGDKQDWAGKNHNYFFAKGLYGTQPQLPGGVPGAVLSRGRHPQYGGEYSAPLLFFPQQFPEFAGELKNKRR